MTEPVAELLAAINQLRQAAAEMPPTPDLTAEYPDVEAVVGHIRAGREMQQKYALASLLEWHMHAFYMRGDPIPDQALAVARIATPASPSPA